MTARVQAVPLDRIERHGDAVIRSTLPLEVESSARPWDYAVSLPLALGAERVLPVQVSAVVEVDRGKLGCLVVGGDWTTPLGRMPGAAGQGRHTVHLIWERGEGSAHLVFRNHGQDEQPCVFRVESVHVAAAPPPLTRPFRHLEEIVVAGEGRLDVARLHAAVECHQLQPPGAGSIDIVSVDALHQRLGLDVALDYPASSRSRPFADWKMEADDAPILRYLYREIRPRRHLEFGTWEGAGACLCLEECDATVWTLNLPDGERTNGERAYETDAGTFIGRRYRDAGLGHRVCQVLCDSREWDSSAYPRGFFDSVLIDGGHTPDVVLSDTRKALGLLRPGGLILWHDFCPDPAVFDAMPATTGVVGALTRDWNAVRASLRDAFWIRPSFLLVGVTA